MRHVSSSQVRSAINRIRSQQRQNEQKLKSALHRWESDVKRAVSQHNTNVRRYNSAVQQYNRERQRVIYKLRSDLNRLAAGRPRYTVKAVYSVSGSYEIQTRTSIEKLILAHNTLGEYDTTATKHDPLLTTIPNSEVRESIDAYNLLAVPDEFSSNVHPGIIGESGFEAILGEVGDEFRTIWLGALHALNPHNPDRARQFMASSRELIRLLLHKLAPDSDVIQYCPNCERDRHGRPTRRSRLMFLCKGLPGGGIADFVEKDIQATIDLVRLLNGGIHRTRNTHDDRALLTIKERVEHCAGFMIALCLGKNEL